MSHQSAFLDDQALGNVGKTSQGERCEQAVDDVQSQLLLVPCSALSDYF